MTGVTKEIAAKREKKYAHEKTDAGKYIEADLFHVVDRKYDEVPLAILDGVDETTWRYLIFRKIDGYKCGALVCPHHDHFEAHSTCAALNACRSFIADMVKYKTEAGDVG